MRKTLKYRDDKGDKEMEHEKYLTETEVMNHLHVSRATLYRLRKEAGLPYQRIGEKLVRYRLTDIEGWLDNYSPSTKSTEEMKEEKVDAVVGDEESQTAESDENVGSHKVPIFRPKSGVFLK
jgi:excisionase family DNA binding protein